MQAVLEEFTGKINKANADARIQWDAVVDKKLQEMVKSLTLSFPETEAKIKETVKNDVLEDSKVIKKFSQRALHDLALAQDEVGEAERKFAKICEEALAIRQERHRIYQTGIRDREYEKGTDMTVVRIVMKAVFDAIQRKDARSLQNFIDKQALVMKLHEATISCVDPSNEEVRKRLEKSFKIDEDLKKFYDKNEAENSEYLERLKKICLYCVLRAGHDIEDTLRSEESITCPH